MKITVQPAMDIVGIELCVSFKNKQIMREKMLDKLDKHRLKWELII